MSKTPVTVPRLWPDSTIVCIASGPSLTQEDVDYVRGKAHVIVVNDNYKKAPWADVLYACDAKWWRWHHKHVASFPGMKYALQQAAGQYPGVQVLKIAGHDGIERVPTGLRTGKNSGYQAMNLAYHFGANRIILLGYDMQRTDNKEHWFGDHPNKGQSPYQAFVKRFEKAAPEWHKLGVEVLNCTRSTALTCFPRMSIQAALPA